MAKISADEYFLYVGYMSVTANPLLAIAISL